MQDGGDAQVAIEADYRALSAEYTRLGVQSRFLDGSDKRGAGMFLARQYPATPGEQYVAVVEANVDPASENMPKTKVSTISALDEEGWKPWRIPKNPTKLEPLGYDKRRAQAPRDVFTQDDPAADTMMLFPRGILMSEKPNNDAWKEGRLMRGESTLSRGACIPPALTTDYVSATNIGHAPSVRRPGDIGGGYGDYDYFEPWQSFGRALRFEENRPPSKDWDPTTKALVLESETTGKTITVPLVGTDFEQPGPTVSVRGAAPRSLWDKMDGARRP